MKMLHLLLFAVVGIVMAELSRLSAAQPPGDEILSSLRIVEDPEGSANVRSGPSLQGKVLEQLRSGTVVAVVPGAARDWVELESDTESGEARYIHSSRLRTLTKWKQVLGRVTKDETGIVGADEFEVKVQGVPFAAGKHRITKDKDGLALVDGKSPWGVDGGLPSSTLTWTVSLRGEPLKVPDMAVNNLFQPNPETLVLLTPGKASDQSVVIMTNSDGAGGYCVAWSFKAGQYCGRIVFMPF